MMTDKQLSFLAARIVANDLNGLIDRANLLPDDRRVDEAVRHLCIARAILRSLGQEG